MSKLVKLTVPEAKNLRYGQILLCMTHQNSDGSPQRFKVNGKIKTWKTRPKEFSIPVKRGMYEHGYITHNDIDDFRLEVYE